MRFMLGDTWLSNEDKNWSSLVVMRDDIVILLEIIQCCPTTCFKSSHNKDQDHFLYYYYYLFLNFNNVDWFRVQGPPTHHLSFFFFNKNSTHLRIKPTWLFVHNQRGKINHKDSILVFKKPQISPPPNILFFFIYRKTITLREKKKKLTQPPFSLTRRKIFEIKTHKRNMKNELGTKPNIGRMAIHSSKHLPHN